MTTHQSTFDLERYRRLIAEHDELAMRYRTENTEQGAILTAILALFTGLFFVMSHLLESALLDRMTVVSGGIFGTLAISSIILGLVTYYRNRRKDRARLDSYYPELADMVSASLYERYDIRNLKVSTFDDWHRAFAKSSEYTMNPQQVTIMTDNYQQYWVDVRLIDSVPTLTNGEIDPEKLTDHSRTA